MWITDEVERSNGKQRIALKAVEKNWETWQIRMMDQLRPSILLPFEFTLEPNEILYDISGKKPLSSHAQLTSVQLEKILDEIEKMMEACSEYWLDSGNFCRDPRHIYIAPDLQIYWIYEPSVEPEEEKTWKKTLLYSILQLGIEKGWDDSAILKCYHEFHAQTDQDHFLKDLQETIKQNAESIQDETDTQMKKTGRKFPYFHRNH